MYTLVVNITEDNKCFNPQFTSISLIKVTRKSTRTANDCENGELWSMSLDDVFSHSLQCQSPNITTESFQTQTSPSKLLQNTYKPSLNRTITMSAQPPNDQAYNIAGNQVDKDPAEKAQSSLNKASAQSSDVDIKIPQKQSQGIEDATPSSLGRGIHGAPPGEEAKGLSEEDVGRNKELDGEQMAAPGEGKVANAVERKPGATGAEQGMETDLDRKKAEQAPLRESIKEEKEKKFDVAGVLGQRSALADPTT